MNTLEIVDKTSLPAGEYYVIDPCYVYPEEKWLLFVNTMPSMGMMRQFGFDFFVFNTSYGDGEYPVYKNGIPIGNCPVDAGLLAIIPAALIEKWGTLKEAGKLGVEVSLAQSEEVEEVDGIAKLGEYIIDTICEDIEIREGDEEESDEME